MLQIGINSKIYLAVEPADFRKRLDGLSALCRQRLGQDPLSGAVFVFRNKNRQMIRVLVFDGQGQWLCTKRFSQGKLNWWPKHEQKTVPLSARQLQVLLWNGNPQSAQFTQDWRTVS